MQSWDKLTARLSGAIDAQFAEKFRHIPRERLPNQRGQIKAGAPLQVLEIVFDDQRHEGEGKSNVPLNTSLPYVEVELSKFITPANNGDHLQRLRDGQWFEIINIRPDGQLWARFDLVYRANGKATI